MTTGDGGDTHDRRDDRDGRGERIGIGGGDDSVTRIQLAARWAEAYAPNGDSLASVLRRFRAAYDYLDAVIHGVEPPDLERDVADAAPVAPPTPTPAYAAPSPPGSSPPEASPPPPPPAEPRPWA